MTHALAPVFTSLQVMTHEICHVMGMKHCYYFHCAMNESNSIDEAVNQPLFLCPICLRKLRKALKFDVLQRYVSLKERCQELLLVSSPLNPDGGHNPGHATAPSPPKDLSSLENEQFASLNSAPLSLDPAHSPPSQDAIHSPSPILTKPSVTSPFNQFQQSLNWLDECLHSLMSSI